MIETIDYDRIISSLEEKLPSLPQILEELVKKLSDPNSNLDNIEELVEVDQSITTQILQVSNKVEFTEPGEERITTIHDALHKLGFENAKKIALNVSVLKLMKLTKSTVNFSCEDLWQHSLGVAIASAEISNLVGYDNPDQAYACGLMHDIGKVIKLMYSKKDFSKEITSAYRKKIDLYDLEIMRNLIRHDIAGAKMMQAWNMPESLILPVLWHHTEDRAQRQDVFDPTRQTLIDIVYFANFLVHKIGIGFSGHAITKVPSDKFLRSMGVDREGLDDLASQINQTFEEACPALLILER
ncbi:MAG: HDOD domain-containing protein [Opitutae bacterium]|nr:HDOD domain-containing protein [Opitutae bacterium]